MPDLEHTFSLPTIDNPTGKCPRCVGTHGGPGKCDHFQYSDSFRKFFLAHLEEFAAAHYNPDKRYAANIRARLEREFATKPPRHSCWCVCPNVAHGRATCDRCRELQRNQKPQESAEIGRTGAVAPPFPGLVEMFDLNAGLLG